MLNKIIREKCSNSAAIHTLSLQQLRNKKIAVDVSIYIYRFLKKNELISSFYQMCSIFRKYNIQPIFVFDGKPPNEKQDTLKKRSQTKKEIKSQILTLKNEIESCEVDNTIADDVKQYRIDTIQTQIEQLEPKCVYIKDYHIRDVKSFIRKYGMSYIDCNGEADVLCAKMCIQEEVYAVLSEDMDIFVYGCPKVIRYFSIIHEECVLYDLHLILYNMSMDLFRFKLLCILSGTDYGMKENNYNIFQYYDYFSKFKKNIWQDIYKILYDDHSKQYDYKNLRLNKYKQFADVLEFIVENRDYIIKALDIYNITMNKQYNYIIQNNKTIDTNVLKEFLQRHYIFVV